MEIDNINLNWEDLLDSTDSSLPAPASISLILDDWLPNQNYYEEDDGQPLDDEEDMEPAWETLGNHTFNLPGYLIDDANISNAIETNKGSVL